MSHVRRIESGRGHRRRGRAVLCCIVVLSTDLRRSTLQKMIDRWDVVVLSIVVLSSRCVATRTDLRRGNPLLLLLMRPLLQLPGLLILTRFSNLSTGLRYRSASNTKLSLPLIRFYSFPVHITFAISLPFSLHDPLGRRHWSLSFTHKLSRVSKSLTDLFGMQNLTYGTNFLHLFAFLVSQPPQSAVLHRQALTLVLNRWSMCLIGSSILVLKLTFSPDPFPRNLPLFLMD